MNYANARFIRSAASAEGFIADGLPQIAFAGRSNVGKSSVINRLLGRRNFARVGATPGKTAHVNYFLIDEKAYFTDLPGYGYAKVSEAEKQRWARLMESYFAAQGLITMGVLIVDCRHMPTQDDVLMADWFYSAGCPLIIAANKADKVKSSELKMNIERIANALSPDGGVPVIVFSAEKGTGKDALISAIEEHL